MTDGQQKVASIVGKPGMCSDDGRAITYGWLLQTNDAGGRGYWSNPTTYWGENGEAEARAWCEANGYAVVNYAWT